MTIVSRTLLVAGLATVFTLSGFAQPVSPYRRDDPLGTPPPVPGYELGPVLPAPTPRDPPVLPAPVPRDAPDVKVLPDKPDELPAPEGEVEGRGPIHEGFAHPGGVARPGPVVPKLPPDPVPELPPEEKPAGDNVIWIPGYWHYDEDRSDFVWVSGIWRVVPKGRKWVPGYWSKVSDGARWVSGFWADAGVPEVPYLDAPPESLERGPSLPAPQEDYTYIPGCWVWQTTRFLWRPGYWCPPYDGFVYCPPRYAWTPRGYLYVSGFWDRPFATRGVLFAPVWFNRPYWNRPGWCFRPRFVVGVNAVFGSLWVRPNAGYYAFGDFYGRRYADRGFQAWVSVGARNRDPLFSQHNVANRGNPNWRRDLVNTYEARNSGRATLPPRTLVAQQRSSVKMVESVTKFKSESLRMTKVTNVERVEREREVTAVRRAGVERQREEARPVTRGKPATLALDRVPAPKVTTPERVLRSIDTKPAPTPRSTREVPRDAVRRSIETPPAVKTPPVVKPAPAPVVKPTPQPKYTPPPTPRVVTPPPTPRIATPAPRPTPRIATPAPRPTPRMTTPAPRPTPRYSPPAGRGGSSGKKR